jgi:radical SAM protein with 4Fe4S-binding SPASM domain
MVTHRIGLDRAQTAIFCLEDFIADDNIVRVIDAFVDVLDLADMGFSHVKTQKTGAPPYHPALLLRIYLYGYLNRVRSSRKLEAECNRNLEMKWLCNSQIPCYHTIATFRTFKQDIFDENEVEKKDEKKVEKKKIGEINHSKALKEVFRALNRFLNGEDLFGKETVATDGTKIRAQNAKKKNYTLDKINKKIELGDAEINKFLTEIEKNDSTEEQNIEISTTKQDLQEKLEELQKWNTRYKGYKAELLRRQEIDPEITQISLTDPDARSIVLNNSGHSEVAFNIVTTVDEKHCLIADFDTHNVKDTSLLAQSLIACKAEFDNDFDPNLHKNNENEEEIDLKTKLNAQKTLNGLADKGFHTADQLHECSQNGIVTYVAVPQPAYSGKDADFTINNFIYDEKQDIYTCPNKKTATTNGQFYDKKDRRGQVQNRFKRYKVAWEHCQNCPFKEKCLSKSSIETSHGRPIERIENQTAADENKKRIATKEGKALYKRRQAIVEHPFGIIKRQWDCSYTLVRGLEKVNGEFAIVFTCYNLRRAVSLLTVKTLLNKLKAMPKPCFDIFLRLFTPFPKHTFLLLKYLPYFCQSYAKGFSREHNLHPSLV